MRVIELDPNDRRWDEFVLASEGASAYHLAAWPALIARTFRHEFHLLAALDDAEQVQGVLPLVHMRSVAFGNFLVSMPFVNYGGVLAKSGTAADALVDAAERLRRDVRASHVELRQVAALGGDLLTRTRKVSMVLDLAPTAEAQWSGFNAKLRNQVRKAEKSGLRFEQGRAELLDEFYAVFARNMRDLGTPVYARRFFAEVIETFPDHTRILAVRHEGRVIAAGIALAFRDTVEMPWASSIAEYKSLCPNNMLYWEAIRFAIEGRWRRFDFGRSTPDEGTYNFKKQWGAMPVQLHWHYLTGEATDLPDLNPANPKYRAAVRVWQRLPLVLTNRLGPMIVRSIP
jgi:FemAB-related protein (PEP-CTERM system-associated)